MADDLHLALLDQIKVASPCPVSWDAMTGDDTTRFCSECSLHVHNLSAMSRDEAESFLQNHRHDERLCATFYRRADGTILTQDCPVGLAAIRAKARRAAGRAIAALFTLFGLSAIAPACSTNQPQCTGGEIIMTPELEREFEEMENADQPPTEKIDHLGVTMGSILMP